MAGASCEESSLKPEIASTGYRLPCQSLVRSVTRKV